MTENYEEKYPLPNDFLMYAAKLRDSCIRKLESITFNSDRSISIKRNVENIVRRTRFGYYSISSIYEDIDSYLLMPSNEYFDQQKFEKMEEKISNLEDQLKEKQSEIERLKGKKSIRNIQLKKNEDSTILNEILEEVGKEKNDEEIWIAINAKLEAQWDNANKYPVFKWVERAEKTFATNNNSFVEAGISETLENNYLKKKSLVAQSKKRKIDDIDNKKKLKVKAQVSPNFFKINARSRNEFLKKLKGDENLNFILNEDTANGNDGSEDDGGDGDGNEDGSDEDGSDEDSSDEDGNDEDEENTNRLHEYVLLSVVFVYFSMKEPNMKSSNSLPLQEKQHSDLINDNFEQHLPIFGNTIKSIKKGFSKWNNMETGIKILDAKLNYFQICHIYSLLGAYISLYNLAIKETSHKYKFLNVDQKINKGISLGVGARKTAIRKWIKIQMLQILGVDTEKLEERIFKALLRINFILINGISSKKELAIAGATRRFFETSTKVEFGFFLFRITGRDCSQEFDSYSNESLNGYNSIEIEMEPIEVY
ncbi:27273_t:CDS:10 [Dentiscutata erythropus]|uniref:27273_t:CDS:1 n=1 Tax=Dentiscutata erythropus TaxID=1348616 RepID=A0A9N8YSI0_9GLOM|nr:27273_t:CDS:10 [Dentiscutata erythropus]